MAIDLDNLQVFTDEELLKLYRWAIAHNAAGQTRSIDGRTIAFPPLEKLTATIDWLEQRINAAGSDGGIVLAEFGER